MPRPTTLPHLFAACTLLLGSSLAQAQYSWIGENGVRHFSDRPPPPSTPPHKILKAPGRVSAVSTPTPAPQAVPPVPGADAATSAARAAPTLAQREADYRKRLLQREEQEKKEAVEAQRRRALAEHCEAARGMRAELESGIRVAKFDAKGERSFLSDEERAAQLARANQALAQCN